MEDEQQQRKRGRAGPHPDSLLGMHKSMERKAIADRVKKDLQARAAKQKGGK